MDSHLILTTRRGWNRRDLLLGAERIRAELRSPETDQNPMNLERLRSVADAIDLVVAVLDDSGDDFGSEALLQIARVTLRAAHNISAGRDAALIDALQDLAVPPHRDEWHWVGYRDESARLLVDAAYQHRETLYRDAPDVPVQSYTVLHPNNGPSGALTCGTLISLWRNSPICRGGCEVCFGLVVALAVAGNDDAWYVFGVCRSCAYTYYRTAPKEEILAELAADLGESPHALPTPAQLLSTNCLPHTALRAALVECGVVLLPPPFYGFYTTNPVTIPKWNSGLIARSWVWACTAVVVHPATGARMEMVPALVNKIMYFNIEYLKRTGRLPELEHDGPEGLRLCYPLVCEEPVVRTRNSAAHG